MSTALANSGTHSTFPDTFFDVPGKVGNSFCDYHLQQDIPGTPHNHSQKIRANLYRVYDEGKLIHKL